MKAQSNDLVLPLALKMKHVIANFFSKHLDNETTLHDVINLVISSHVTSMVHVLEIATKNHPKASEDMKLFCDRLVGYISGDQSVSHMNMETKTVYNER